MFRRNNRSEVRRANNPSEKKEESDRGVTSPVTGFLN
jgi:hypothetical protein